MSETIFHFRQFTVHQEKCAMKVGTDAVLLGSWIKPRNANRILDVGTGSGIIALMIAQKCSAQIDAIDIDANAYHQARENFMISPWFGRMSCTHISFQEFSETHAGKYDMIVTNPPYFHHASKPAEESRLNARHSHLLSFDELVTGAIRLMNPQGRFCLILPCKEGMEFIDKAQRKDLFCNHILRIKTKADKNEKRLIMEFGSHFGIMTEDEIIIQEEDGSYTQEYIDLTREYFMHLKPSQSVFQQS